MQNKIQYLKLVNILLLGFFATAKISADSNPPPKVPEPIFTENWQEIPFVAANDPKVISVANFATSKMQRGSLNKIVYAQKKDVEDGALYVLTLDIVNAHFIHQSYTVQVFVPKNDSPWTVIYFSTTKH